MNALSWIEEAGERLAPSARHTRGPDYESRPCANLTGDILYLNQILSGGHRVVVSTFSFFSLLSSSFLFFSPYSLRLPTDISIEEISQHEEHDTKSGRREKQAVYLAVILPCRTSRGDDKTF